MADNTVIPTGVGGDSIATDDLSTLNGGASGSVKVQRVKMGFGVDGDLKDVNSTQPLPVATVDVTASGTLTAAAQTVVLQLSGQSGAAAAVTGTWVGTLTFEGSLDGVRWDPINAVSASTSAPQTTATANGLYRITPGALQQIRVNMTAFTSGSASIAMRASLGTGGIFANQILPIKITDGTNTAAIKAANTAAVAADQAIVVSLSPNTPVALAALTKGTQGGTGVSTQDLKDAGRNLITHYMLIPVAATATDTLQSLTGTKGGATVTATTTPAVVTTGKTFRVTRFSATYIATATTGHAIARLRFNTAGVAAVTSPIAAVLDVGAGTPATANSAASEEASFVDGMEFAAGTGIGISVQGFAGAVAGATGLVIASVTGFEY